MNAIDFNLHNIPMLLSASEDKEYQDRIIKKSEMLVNFLLKNGLLVNIEPFDEKNEIKKDLVIRMSNVTDLGLELFKKIIPSWFAYLDKGGEIENVSRLEKGLEKLKKSK